MKLPMIAVHGGAGSWKDDRIPVGIEFVEKAAKVGFEILKKGGDAVDAAEACTLFMESCGSLNAGKGARPNQDGVQELDAMIVDGSNLQFGSVGAIIGIQNPISLARYIMEKTCGDRSYGARPLRRALQKYVEDPLSDALIQGTLPKPAELEVYLEDTGICCRQINEQPVAAGPGGEEPEEAAEPAGPGIPLYSF